MKIGLSLSNCVLDILSSEVRLSSVTAIVANTRYERASDAYDDYKTIQWRDYERYHVQDVLSLVWPKLIQPRLTGGPLERWCHYTGKDGFWMEAKDWPEATPRRPEHAVQSEIRSDLLQRILGAYGACVNQSSVPPCVCSSGRPYGPPLS